MGIGQSLVAFWLFGSLSRRFHNRGCSLKGSLIICLCCLGKPFKKTFFLGKLSQMWVEGVADSQTRSKPLKKNKSPWKSLFLTRTSSFIFPNPTKTLGWVHTRHWQESRSREKNRESKEKFLSRSRKFDSFHFSFFSRFSRVARQISLSTLDFREWQDKFLFLLSIFS